LISVEFYDSQKKPAGKVELPEKVFGSPVRPHLYQEVIKWQLARRRQGTAATKTRSFVRGGGKKPWRQKGTGRARSGASRSPIWRGGGIIFGPHPRDYDYNLPHKVKKAALRSALSEKLAENRLLILAGLELPEIKTKEFLKIMAGLGVDKALILIDAENPKLKLSARNVKKFKVMPVAGLNLFDILHFDHLILTRGVLPELERILN
jgi:large subunit ribosomal protein L4